MKTWQHRAPSVLRGEMESEWSVWCCNSKCHFSQEGTLLTEINTKKETHTHTHTHARTHARTHASNAHTHDRPGQAQRAYCVHTRHPSPITRLLSTVDSLCTGTSRESLPLALGRTAPLGRTDGVSCATLRWTIRWHPAAALVSRDQPADVLDRGAIRTLPWHIT